MSIFFLKKANPAPANIDKLCSLCYYKEQRFFCNFHIGGEKYDAYSIMYDEYMKNPFSF